MRKHLVALFSIFGLAGSTLPAQSQVLKGSKPTPNSIETKRKLEKNASESKALKHDADIKLKKSGQEANAASSNAQIKMNKSNALTVKQTTVGHATSPQTSSKTALTKGNQQITKGNNALTKAKQ
jgi:hypothetical protein